MNYSTLTQIIFLIIGIAILSTFTRPMLVSIKALQDEIFLYSDAKNKASEFNDKLNSVLAQEQAFQRSDLRDLDVYLPSSIDTLAVMSDIEVIVRKNNLLLTALASGNAEDSQSDVSFEEQYAEDGVTPIINETMSADFKLTISGDYENFKNMLLDLEQNKYPLDVVELQIGAVSVTQSAVVTQASASEPGSTYNLVLRTYAFDYTESVIQPQLEAGFEQTTPTI